MTRQRGPHRWLSAQSGPFRGLHSRLPSQTFNLVGRKFFDSNRSVNEVESEPVPRSVAPSKRQSPGAEGWGEGHEGEGESKAPLWGGGNSALHQASDCGAWFSPHRGCFAAAEAGRGGKSPARRPPGKQQAVWHPIGKLDAVVLLPFAMQWAQGFG